MRCKGAAIFCGLMAIKLTICMLWILSLRLTAYFLHVKTDLASVGGIRLCGVFSLKTPMIRID
jgi:hypothetical protein